MISKKHFTKSMATILSTLTFLTAVSPCTFAEKNFNRNTTRSMSTANKIFLAGAGAIGLAVVIGGAVYGLSKDPTAELLKAIKSNNTKKAKEILDRDYNDIDFDSLEKSHKFNETLHSRDMMGMLCLIEAYKCDVNATGNYGLTPLHDAALWVHKEVCELLLEKGADVNAKDKYGKTPLDVAHTNEIKKLLLDNGAKYGNELK